MKKIKKIIFVLSLALVVLPCLVSCSKGKELEKYVNTINESVTTSTKVESTLTIKDSDVVVYNQVKELTIISGSKATAVYTTTSLSDSFELVTGKTTEIIENLQSTDLFNLNLQEELFKTYTLKDNNFSGEIDNENISKVFNSNIKIKDLAKLSITFENKKIKKIECAYVTDTNRAVTLSTVYEY